MTPIQLAQAILEADTRVSAEVQDRPYRRAQEHLNHLCMENGVEIAAAYLQAVEELKEAERVLTAMSTSAAHAASWVKPRSDAAERRAAAETRAQPAATGEGVKITDAMIDAVYANVTPNDIMTGETEPVRRALIAVFAAAGIKCE